MIKRILTAVSVSLFAMLILTSSSVAANSGGTGIMGLLDLSKSFLDRAVVLIVSIAVVFFMYNVFQYTIAGNEEKKKTAKEGIVWGIAGIFIMVSIWGLVRILTNTFSLDNTLVEAPKIEIPGN